MANGGIVDISAGVAQTIGRYFSVVSVIPSSLYITFVYVLISSGSWQHSPNWGRAVRSLEQLGVGGIAFLAFLSVAFGVLIHPIQFAIVQFFEGYWGASSFAQALRAQRILRYQRLCQDLAGQRNRAQNQLVSYSRAGVLPPAARTPLQSRLDETSRVINTFPRGLSQIMPTRLGNALRRSESNAGSQYALNSLQILPQLLLIAPPGHVDYVNDQRSQLDLAVRMTFISALAAPTAMLFLWPYRLWVLVAIIPYVLAYLSYRGSVVAARLYGSALDTLMNLDRFALYEQLRLELPVDTAHERETNEELARLLSYDDAVVLRYQHPDAADRG
jgi:hypothetical protein